MKQSKLLLAIIFCLVFALFCCLLPYLIWGVSSCVSTHRNNKEKLTGNFFDEAVLKRCEISFLQKPENVTNEVFSNDGYSYYEYSCEIESFSDFENYAKSILQGLIDNDYTFGYYVDSLEGDPILTSHYTYLKIYPSLDIIDYSDYEGTHYRFFYTPQKYYELKEEFGGRLMGHREIRLKISYEPNATGRYKVEMTMYGGNSKSKWGAYIFEKD